MIFTLTNPQDTTKLSDYVTVKYAGIDELKSFTKNTEENTITIEVMNSDDRLSNEKDLINSIKQFTSDNNISVNIQY